MKTVIEMAKDVGAYIADLPLENAVLFEVDILSGRSAKLEAFAELVRADAFEQNRQEGMKQERALWEPTKLEQEIEAPPEQEPTLQEQLDEAYADMAQANADKEKASADGEKAYNEAKRIEKLIDEKNT